MGYSLLIHPKIVKIHAIFENNKQYHLYRKQVWRDKNNNKIGMLIFPVFTQYQMATGNHNDVLVSINGTMPVIYCHQLY